MQKITPFLWFDNNAEEAMNFYTSVFKNAKVGKVARYGDTGPGPKGTVMTAEFSLEGVEFVALNGGPHFKFNEAVSFVVNCETQEEVDYFWEKLSEGGEKSRCGWLKDRFGLSWQVTPIVLTELINSPDQAKVDRVMKAMMEMDKIEIEPILRAAHSRTGCRQSRTRRDRALELGTRGATEGSEGSYGCARHQPFRRSTTKTLHSAHHSCESGSHPDG